MSEDFIVSYPVFAIFGLAPNKSPLEAVHNPPYLDLRDKQDRAGVFAIPLFTNQDLAKDWCENNPQIDGALTKWLRLNTTEQFAEYLDRLRLPDHITHLVFDPHHDRDRSPSVMSLAYIRGELQRRRDCGPRAR